MAYRLCSSIDRASPHGVCTTAICQSFRVAECYGPDTRGRVLQAKKSGLKGRSFNHPVGIHTCPITQIDAAILCSPRRGRNCTLV
ncbi:hypothetical protein PXNS11_230136 [Stutzerimonas xanthomarina]|nr:hypothetical protein PXNS11_230136 [Stutzerimonas xanthomarina]